MNFKHFWEKYREESTEGDGGGGGNTTVVGDPAAAGGPDGTPGADPAVSVPADWPTDWRVKLSPDGKHTKTLERFASPNALFDSYQAMRQKLDSGELKSTAPYPDKGTPEAQAAWRKAHSIPEKPEDYNATFKDGLVIGEVDKPFVDDFLKVAHSVNADPAQVNGLLHWYYEQQEKAVEMQEERDVQYLQASEDALRAEWGGEYRTNINMIAGLVQTLPEEVRDLFVNARLGNGDALLNHPDMARWLVHTARTINPVHSVVPGAGANIAGAIDDEIASIEKTMRENRPAYNADEKMQARLRELYSARERAH